MNAVEIKEAVSKLEEAGFDVAENGGCVSL
jgi:hypothetical protein